MKNQNKNTEILSADYQKFLAEIQELISQTQSNIVRNFTRQKVEMAWKIGQKIHRQLPKNTEDLYGKNLIEQLERDTRISKTVLYKMHSFYKAYSRRIPQDDEHLNWSHYRVLAGIKKADERKYLENLARENVWDARELQQEVTKTKIAQIRENKALKTVVEKKKNIKPQRGKLFVYKIKKIVGSEKYYFDCGFGVFREIIETLPRGLGKEDQIVLVSKEGGKYSIRKSTIRPQEMHTYKAFVEKPVDGDTIRINLDLGFGIFQHEILRLAKINAPEISTEAGKKSAKELEKILKTAPFLILKSIKTDIYGRYVADVFLAAAKNTDPQVVADEGVYLNQLLLDRGVAEVF